MVRSGEERRKDTCLLENCSWKLAWRPEPHNLTNSFKEARTIASLGGKLFTSEETQIFLAMEFRDNFSEHAARLPQRNH